MFEDDDDDKKRPRRKLTDLVLEEVSLVDRPANQHARVVLCKRDGGSGGAYEFADLYAAYETGAYWPAWEDEIVTDVAFEKSLNIPTVAELDALESPLKQINREIDEAARELREDLPDRFRDHSSARGAILAANPGVAADHEALQAANFNEIAQQAWTIPDRGVGKTQRNEENMTELTLDNVMKASADMAQNVVVLIQKGEANFDVLVRKNQLPGEKFETAYARILDTPAGHEFYAERQRLKYTAAVSKKVTEDAIRAGRVSW
jgi:hypothetical protein